MKYCWPLNNTGVNAQVHLHVDFFSMVNTTLLYNLRLVESAMLNLGYRGTKDMEVLGRTNSKLHMNILMAGRVSTPIPRLFKGQLYKKMYNLVHRLSKTSEVQ